MVQLNKKGSDAPFFVGVARGLPRGLFICAGLS
jgi:hypothetical protein